MDTLISILHVGTAVFLIGPMAILPMTGLRALRSGNGDQVRTLAKSTLIFSALSLFTFVFGFGAMAMADEKYNLSITTPWILWSIILYVIAFAVNVFLVVPQMRKAADEISAAPDGGAVAVGKPSGYGAIAGGSGVVALLLVAVVVLMIWKP